MLTGRWRGSSNWDPEWDPAACMDTLRGWAWSAGPATRYQDSVTGLMSFLRRGSVISATGTRWITIRGPAGAA